MKATNVNEVVSVSAEMLIANPWRPTPEEAKEYTEKKGDKEFMKSKEGKALAVKMDAAKLLVDSLKHEKSTPEYATAVDKLRDKLPKEVIAEMDMMGIRSPLDMVDISLDVGTLVYDIYNQFVVVPQAPVAVMRHNKKLMTLAEEVQKEEFEVSSEVLTVVEKPASNDAMWQSVVISLAVVLKDKEKVYRQVRSGAIVYFPKVMEAFGKLFEGTNG